MKKNLLSAKGSSVVVVCGLLLLVSLLHPCAAAFSGVVQPATTTTTTRRRKSSRPRNNAALLHAEHCSNIWDTVNTFYSTQPYLAAALTCGCKATLADRLAQQRQQNNASFDAARNAAFLLYGLLYQGLFVQFLYSVLYPSLLNNVVDNLELMLLQMILDLFVFGPCCNLPVAYSVKSLTGGSDIRNGWQQYIHDIQHARLLQYFWIYWSPVQCVTFSVIPLQFRVAFVAVCSFFWVFVLSTIIGGADNCGESPQSAALTTTRPPMAGVDRVARVNYK